MDLRDRDFTIVSIYNKADPLLIHATFDLTKCLADHHPWLVDYIYDGNKSKISASTVGVGLVDYLPSSCLKLMTNPKITAIFQEYLGTTEIVNTFDIPQLVSPLDEQEYLGFDIGNPLMGLLTLTAQRIGEELIQPGSLVLYKKGNKSIFPCNQTDHPWIGLRMGYLPKTCHMYDAALRSCLFFNGRFSIHFKTTGITPPKAILDNRRLLATMNPEIKRLFVGEDLRNETQILSLPLPNGRQYRLSGSSLKKIAEQVPEVERRVEAPEEEEFVSCQEDGGNEVVTCKDPFYRFEVKETKEEMIERGDIKKKKKGVPEDAKDVKRKTGNGAILDAKELRQKEERVPIEDANQLEQKKESGPNEDANQLKRKKERDPNEDHSELKRRKERGPNEEANESKQKKERGPNEDAGELRQKEERMPVEDANQLKEKKKSGPNEDANQLKQKKERGPNEDASELKRMERGPNEKPNELKRKKERGPNEEADELKRKKERMSIADSNQLKRIKERGLNVDIKELKRKEGKGSIEDANQLKQKKERSPNEDASELRQKEERMPVEDADQLKEKKESGPNEDANQLKQKKEGGPNEDASELKRRKERGPNEKANELKRKKERDPNEEADELKRKKERMSIAHSNQLKRKKERGLSVDIKELKRKKGKGSIEDDKELRSKKEGSIENARELKRIQEEGTTENVTELKKIKEKGPNEDAKELKKINEGPNEDATESKRTTGEDTLSKYLNAIYTTIGNQTERQVLSQVLLLCRAIKTKLDPLPDVFFAEKEKGLQGYDLVSLLIYPDDAPPDMFPVSVRGDGNCLFRSLSYAVYGNQERWREMRLRTVIGMIEHMDYLICNNFVGRDKDGKLMHDILVFSQLSDSAYRKVDTVKDAQDLRKPLWSIAKDTTKEGEWAGVWQIGGAARALNSSILCLYPSERVGIPKDCQVRKLYNRRFGLDDTKRTLTIMATSIALPKKNTRWRMDHFVPCVKAKDTDQLREFLATRGDIMDGCDTSHDAPETIICVDSSEKQDDEDNSQGVIQGDGQKTRNGLTLTQSSNNIQEINSCFENLKHVLHIPEDSEELHIFKIPSPLYKDVEFPPFIGFSPTFGSHEYLPSPQASLLQTSESEKEEKKGGDDGDNMKEEKPRVKVEEAGGRENVAEENKTGKSRNLNRKLPEMKDVLETLSLIRKGIFSPIPLKKVKDTAISHSRKIEIMSEKLTDIPFHTSFVKTSKVDVSDPTISVYKKKDIEDLELYNDDQGKISLSSHVLFDTTTTVVVSPNNEELSSDFMRDTRCFMVTKSSMCKVHEIRGVREIKDALRVFVAYKEAGQKKGKNKKNDVYSVFDKKEGTCNQYRPIHTPIVKDTLYVVHKRPMMGKCSTDYFNPLEEKTKNEKHFRHIQSDWIRNRIKAEELKKLKDLIELSEADSMQLVAEQKKLSLPAVGHAFSLLDSTISDLTKELGSSSSFPCHDIAKYADELVSLTARLVFDKDGNISDRDSILALRRIVEIVICVRNTTVNENIKKIFQYGKPIEQAILFSILPQPETFSKVVKEVAEFVE